MVGLIPGLVHAFYVIDFISSHIITSSVLYKYIIVKIFLTTKNSNKEHSPKVYTLSTIFLKVFKVSYKSVWKQSWMTWMIPCLLFTYVVKEYIINTSIYHIKVLYICGKFVSKAISRSHAIIVLREIDVGKFHAN